MSKRFKILLKKTKKECYRLQDSVHSIFQDKKYICRQFTGVVDKNGKEVYEGDMIRWWWDTEEDGGYFPGGCPGYSLVETPQKVIFKNGCFGFESDRFRLLFQEKFEVIDV